MIMMMMMMMMIMMMMMLQTDLCKCSPSQLHRHSLGDDEEVLQLLHSEVNELEIQVKDVAQPS